VLLKILETFGKLIKISFGIYKATAPYISIRSRKTINKVWFVWFAKVFN